jgi:NADPH2:quinone reductase
VKHVVPSRRVRVDRIGRQLFEGRGFDIVLDSVGGPGLGSGLRALRPGGRLVTLGVSSMTGRGLLGALLFLLRAPRFGSVDLIQQSRGVFGVNLRQLMKDAPLMRRILELLLRDAAAGELHPEPGRVMPLEEAAHAHELLESRTNIGKIVLRVT